MLSRLEESFQRLSDFSSDLAHELRTPVSNLLTQTQVMLSRARSADEYRDVLASNAEEFERLSRMISDMLFLAKADNNQIIPSLESVDLAEEVRGLLEYYEILAEEKRLRLSMSGNGVANGDRLMLRRAISNLLSDAIRHTPEDAVSPFAFMAVIRGRSVSPSKIPVQSFLLSTLSVYSTVFTEQTALGTGQRRGLD